VINKVFLVRDAFLRAEGKPFQNIFFNIVSTTKSNITRYITVERVDPDSCQSGSAAIAALPIVTRKSSA